MLLYQTYTNNQDAADNTLNRLLNHPGTLTNHAQSRARECNLTVIVAPHHAGCKHAILAPVVANMNNAKGLGDTRGTAISHSIICRPSDVAPCASGLGLESFLIMPVQRMPQYVCGRVVQSHGLKMK